MAVVEELIRSEESGAISFGNHELAEKAKVDSFEHAGDTYKVKTYSVMTKLEKNGAFLFESVPGTSVLDFTETEDELSFVVEGNEDAQLTIGLEDGKDYEVTVAGEDIGRIATNMGGKLVLSLELEAQGEVKVTIKK